MMMTNFSGLLLPSAQQRAAPHHPNYTQLVTTLWGRQSTAILGQALEVRLGHVHSWYVYVYVCARMHACHCCLCVHLWMCGWVLVSAFVHTCICGNSPVCERVGVVLL